MWWLNIIIAIVWIIIGIMNIREGRAVAALFDGILIGLNALLGAIEYFEKKV